MEKILLTAAAAVALLVLLYALWGGIHLLAHLRLGYRRMGCRGPQTDAYGKQVCCRTGETCDQLDPTDDTQAKQDADRQTPESKS